MHIRIAPLTTDSHYYFNTTTRKYVRAASYVCEIPTVRQMWKRERKRDAKAME